MTKSNSSLAAPITWGTKPTAAATESQPEAPAPIVVSTNRPRENAPTQPLRYVAMLGLFGVGLYLLAFAFGDSGYVGFFAVAPWAWMVLDARRMTAVGYLILYGCGFAMWFGLRELGSAQSGIIMDVGDALLVLYLAIYLPAFIALGRLGRETLRLPVMIWLPIVWMALECVRCNLFAGFSLGALAHAIAHLREVVQIADLLGSYGLGAWMVASGSAVAQLAWTLRRVRFLERKVTLSPTVDDAARIDVEKVIEDERAFTSAGRFRPTMRPASRGVPQGKPTDVSVQSMKQAVRRNRDVARDRDLATAAFSILAIAISIVLAANYAHRRVVETSKWKMFEGYRYVVSAIGGKVTADVFQKATEESSKRGLIVYATVDPNPTTVDTASRSVLSINPKQTAARDAQVDASFAGTHWISTLRRSSGEVTQYDVGTSLGANRWFIGYRPMAASPIAYPRDEFDVRIRVLPVFAYGSTVEQTLNDALHGYIQRGKSIDAAVVVIEPGISDGSGWPRLMNRAVILAATANRCPLISVVPDSDSFVAAGDGTIHQASAVGGSGSEVVSFSAMIDPRDSLYAKTGELPAISAVMCCLLLLLWQSYEGAQRWRETRLDGVADSERDTNSMSRPASPLPTTRLASNPTDDYSMKEIPGAKT